MGLRPWAGSGISHRTITTIIIIATATNTTNTTTSTKIATIHFQHLPRCDCRPTTSALVTPLLLLQILLAFQFCHQHEQQLIHQYNSYNSNNNQHRRHRYHHHKANNGNNNRKYV